MPDRHETLSKETQLLALIQIPIGKPFVNSCPCILLSLVDNVFQHTFYFWNGISHFYYEVPFPPLTVNLLSASNNAGKFEWMAWDDTFMGCKLVHYWGTLKRTIFCKVNNTINRKKSICTGYYSRKLVSESYLHIPPQLLLKKRRKRGIEWCFFLLCWDPFFSCFL